MARAIIRTRGAAAGESGRNDADTQKASIRFADPRISQSLGTDISAGAGAQAQPLDPGALSK